MNMASDPIPAIAESEATGDTAVLFADIRESLGVPVVNLIFRHLATFPQALPWSWQTLKPLYLDGTIDAQAELLRESLSFSLVTGISRQSLSDAGLSRSDMETIRMILRSYERSNALNLVAFSALLAKLNGEKTSEPLTNTIAPATNTVRGQMPKPLTLAEMDDQTRAMTLHLAGLGGADAIMPTMYRHLAHWPSYLSILDELLTPLDQQQILQASIKTLIADATNRGRQISVGLAQAAIDLEPSHRAALVGAIENFLEGVIAKMVVVVGVIKEGMPAND